MLARNRTPLLVLWCTVLLAVPATATDLDTQALLDIVEGITVTESSALNFGDVALGNGVLTIDTAGALSDPDFLSFDAAGISQGVFNIAAVAGASYDISLVETAPAAGLTLDNFTINIDGGPDEAGADTFLGVALGNASSVLNVGADLTVDATTASLGDNQTIGYRVTVDFN